MIGRLNHVAIAVPELAGRRRQYRNALGAAGVRAGTAARAWRHGRVRHAAQHQDRAAGAAGREVADRGIPGAQSRPAASITSATRWTTFCAARDQLKAAGARVLGDGEPKIGAHGKPVLFLHPKDFNGTLVEIEQA